MSAFEVPPKKALLPNEQFEFSCEEIRERQSPNGRNLSLERLDERVVVKQVEPTTSRSFTQGFPKLTSLKFSIRASDGLMP